MSQFPKKKVTPLPKKTLLTSEKVTTSEEVDKVTKILDDMKEAVVKIRRKDLDKFQSKGSTGWFNIDHASLRKNVSALKPELYQNTL